MQQLTSDHDEIRRWAEKHGGHPAILDHPIARADKLGIRIDFPGETHEVLMTEKRAATWDEFFKIFEEQRLLFSYDDEPRGRDPSDWYRFEKRDAQPENGE